MAVDECLIRYYVFIYCFVVTHQKQLNIYDLFRISIFDLWRRHVDWQLMLACDWLILNLAQPITIMTRIALCVSDETEITVLVLINCTSSLFGRRNMFRYDYLILLNRKHANRPFLLHATSVCKFRLPKSSAPWWGLCELVVVYVSDKMELAAFVPVNRTNCLFDRRNMFRYDYLILLNRKHANRPFLLHVTRFVNFQVTKNSAHGAVIGRTSLFLCLCGR